LFCFSAKKIGAFVLKEIPCGFLIWRLYIGNGFCEDRPMGDPLRCVVDCLRSLASRHQLEGVHDSELLRCFVDTHSSEAFACLMHRHGPMLLGLARRVVRDHQLAEDVFQATFLVLARKAHAIRGRKSLPAWLHSVALHLAIKAKRSRQRLLAQAGRAPVPGSPDPLDELSARELLAILDEEMARLPEKYRAPLILCHLEGVSQEEAARRLNVRSGSIKGMLERGRLLLRKRLAARSLPWGAALASVLELGSTVQAVSPALVRATLRAAVTRQGASAAAVALAEGAITMMTIAKIKAVFWAVMVVAVAGAGAGWFAKAAATGQTDEASRIPKLPLNAKSALQSKKVSKALDLHGDALPEGAARRLGTLQLRAAGAELGVSPDGKTLIGIKGGKYVSVWDVESGKLMETRELPFPSTNLAALSSDGRWLAQGNRRGSLEVWAVETGRLLHALARKEAMNLWIGPVFSADGRQLAAGWLDAPDYDKVTIRVWDLTSGKQTFKQTIRSGGGGALASFTRDGQKLLVAFRPSNTIEGAYFFDIPAEKQLWHAKDFYSASWVAFTADGHLLSIEGARNLATGEKVTLKNLPRFDQDGAVITMPDGRTLLFSDSAGVHVWDLATAKELRTLVGAGDQMLLTPDGKTLITNNGSLQRWELSTGKPLYPDNFASGHNREVVTMVFSGDGTHLASGARDGSVRFWDATTGRPIHVWRGEQARRPRRTEQVEALDMTPDGHWIIAGGGGGRLRVWDTVLGKEAGAIALPKPVQSGPLVHHLRIRPDGRRAVGMFGWILPFGPSVPGKRGVEAVPFTDWVINWDLKTGALLTKAQLAGISNGDCASLSRDGRKLVIWDAVVRADTGIEVLRLEGGSKGIHGIPSAISPDGSLIAEAVSEQQEIGKFHIPGIVRIWETATGKAIANLNTKSWAGQLVFDPSNRFVAVNDDGIQVWEISTGKVVATLRLPAGDRAQATTFIATLASCLAFAPDGRRLATGHPDGTILLWNTNLPAPQPVRLTAADVAILWADLKDNDAAEAWRAVWRLAESAEDVLPFLRENVKPAYPVAAEITTPLLTDLGSESFTKRDAASKRLKELGVLAESAYCSGSLPIRRWKCVCGLNLW
jgi:RNA polymerase sigma factor (sigma-70 family)